MKQQRKRSAGQRREMANKSPLHISRRATPIASRDFNRIENSNEAIVVIGNIAAQAGRSAASEVKALRMAKIYAQSARVILETADGQRNIVATATQLPQRKYFKKYPTGTVMHVVKK